MTIVYVHYLSVYTHTLQHVHTSTSDFWPHHIQSLYRAHVFQFHFRQPKKSKAFSTQPVSDPLRILWKDICLFCFATALNVGFVGSLEGTTFLVSDSYKPYICRWHPAKQGTLPTVDRPLHIEDSEEGRCFHRYFDISWSCWNREGRDLPRSGVVEWRLGKACKKRFFWERFLILFGLAFCDVGFCSYNSFALFFT